jgi:hypothetical protein
MGGLAEKMKWDFSRMAAQQPDILPPKQKMVSLTVPDRAGRKEASG